MVSRRKDEDINDYRKRANEYTKKYRRTNPERVKEIGKRGYVRHREQRREQQNRYNAEHREYVNGLGRKRSKKYRQTQKYKDYQREYIQTEDYKNRHKESSKKYYEDNKKTDKFKITSNKASKTSKKRLRDSLIELLGGICVICKTIEQLEIDHIFGGGAAEIKSRFNNDPRTMYRYYLKHIEEAKERLQILCKSHHKEKSIRAYTQQWNVLVLILRV